MIPVSKLATEHASSRHIRGFSTCPFDEEHTTSHRTGICRVSFHKLSEEPSGSAALRWLWIFCEVPPGDDVLRICPESSASSVLGRIFWVVSYRHVEAGKVVLDCACMVFILVDPGACSHSFSSRCAETASGGNSKLLKTQLNGAFLQQYQPIVQPRQSLDLSLSKCRMLCFSARWGPSRPFFTAIIVWPTCFPKCGNFHNRSRILFFGPSLVDFLFVCSHPGPAAALLGFQP